METRFRRQAQGPDWGVPVIVPWRALLLVVDAIHCHWLAGIIWLGAR